MGNSITLTKNRGVKLYFFLAVLALLPYIRAIHYDFIELDDSYYVTKNPYVRAGVTWKTFFWAFHSTQEGHWHPLTWLSHALDVQLFQLNPSAHHTVNIILHIINVALVLFLLQRATAFTWRNFLVAALFAVHPINVESVAWIAERKNLLCTMFFLAALGAYGWYAIKPGIKRYILVAAAFTLGLMAKSMVVTLPFVLLLADYWPLRRLKRSSEGRFKESFRQLVLEKMPLMAIAAAISIVALLAERAAGGPSRLYGEFFLSVRLENAIVSYARYLWKVIWPSHLAFLYPYPDHLLPTWIVLSSAGFLIVVSGAAIWLRRHRWLLVGWFWYLGTLVPVIGLVRWPGKPYAMADRYAYIPLLGLCLIAVYGVAELAATNPAIGRYVPVLAMWVILALSATTRVQVGYWQDVLTLWDHTLAVTDNNFMAHDFLAGALIVRGRSDEALAHLTEAARINPNDPVAQVEIATYEQEHGKLQESIARYHRTLQLTSDPDLKATALYNLSLAYRAIGDEVHARESMDSANVFMHNQKR